MSHFFPGTVFKPYIRADPGPIINLGRDVTIWCHGSPQSNGYQLYKGRFFFRGMTLFKPRDTSAYFKIPFVDTHHAGEYRCACGNSGYWSELSDPLLLIITGVYQKPFLSAQPGLLVLSGDRLTLKCLSKKDFHWFVLTKDEKLSRPWHFSRKQQSPTFTLSPVDSSSGGQYRCYGGYNLYAWSAPSDPLDILVAGQYAKPSLSAHPGTSVTSSKDVTLECRSGSWFDLGFLFKEGFMVPLQRLQSQNHAGPFQASFILSSVTSAQGGTYRCYLSRSSSPHLLSHPSDPVELVVSGSTEERHYRDLKSESLRDSSSPATEIQENWYEGAKRTHLGGERWRDPQNIRGRWDAAVRDEQPEEEMELDSWDGAPEDTPDVTYAQLSHSTFKKHMFTPPSSQSGETPDKRNVYATLACTLDQDQAKTLLRGGGQPGAQKLWELDYENSPK
ncbi:leukocyte immunoglobulin-like receptor subfamily B member 3 [Rhynchocyon petersi]